MTLWVATVFPASGQTPFRSSDELEKTDQVIEKAKQAVAESGSNRARALVQNAITLQERTWDHFRKRIYQQARRFRHGWADVERCQARELIEKAQERWDRLEGAVIDSGDQWFRDMYRRAGEHLRRTQSMLRQKKIIRALTQVRAAVEILDRLEENLP